MTTERELAQFISTAQLTDIPLEDRTTAKQVMLAVCGTAVAGSTQDGISGLRSMLTGRGGRPEARSLVYGDVLPATSAAMLNATICRALDYCDAMAPGLHLGSSVVPVALAAAELRGGCQGDEFLTALAVGLETGARLNLSEEMYDGLDPTGIAGVMGATATAARILELTEEQTLHALSLAFNRCAGSFQSNIDGSLAVRLIQGWVAESAIQCVQLALHGLTGPHNFLSGVYGYAHLFARGQRHPASFTSGIGHKYHLSGMVFKKYPSCGATQGATELILNALSAGVISPAAIDTVDVRLPPYTYRLVGQEFKAGNTPRVDAQFSIQYCVANALVRGSSRLTHFEPHMIADPTIAGMMKKIRVEPDEELNVLSHTATQLSVRTVHGATWEETLDVAPGFPRNPLTAEQHVFRFRDCLGYAELPISDSQVSSLQFSIENLEEMPDVHGLLDQLISAAASTADEVSGPPILIS